MQYRFTSRQKLGHFCDVIKCSNIICFLHVEIGSILDSAISWNIWYSKTLEMMPEIFPHFIGISTPSFTKMNPILPYFRRTTRAGLVQVDEMSVWLWCVSCGSACKWSTMLRPLSGKLWTYRFQLKASFSGFSEQVEAGIFGLWFSKSSMGYGHFVMLNSNWCAARWHIIMRCRWT